MLRPIRLPRLPALTATGILLGLSFPPFPFPALAWVALLPLLIVWMETASARRAWIDAFVAFLITFSVAFQWPLFHAMPETAWLSLPGLLIMPLWMALPFGLATPFRRRLGSLPGFLTLAALFVLMEVGFRRGPLAFPWSLLGHTQADLDPIHQLAALGGVPLLTLFVLMVNGLLLGMVLCARRRAAVVSGASAAVLIAAALVGGWISRPEIHPTDLRMGIIQPGLPAREWADVHDHQRVDVLLTLNDGSVTGALNPADTTRSLAPQIWIWPETALPPDGAIRSRVRRWVDSAGVAVITGAVLETDSGGYYNAAVLYNPGETPQIYRKRRLVPFAEGVPFEDRWPWLRRLALPAGGVRGYLAGKEGDLLKISDVSLGVLICFESLFDDLVRDYADGGARAIITLTQDGWWGDSFGYKQHLAFNRLRAIESGLPLIQVSVSGLSGVIGPDGAVTERIGWMQQAVRPVVVPERVSPTPYMRFGDWVSVASLGVLLLACVSLVRRRHP